MLTARSQAKVRRLMLQCDDDRADELYIPRPRGRGRVVIRLKSVVDRKTGDVRLVQLPAKQKRKKKQLQEVSLITQELPSLENLGLFILKSLESASAEFFSPLQFFVLADELSGADGGRPR